METNFEIIAKTFFGLEDVLAKELKDIGAKNIEIKNRAVGFFGDLEMLYKANLHLRTAIKILMPIAKFKVYDAETLYENVKKIEWDKYLRLENTFSVDASVFSVFKHTGYPALKTKDAIVDYFREKFNERPSVDTSSPDMKINLYINKNDATISLDTSGEPLFKRNYRKDNVITSLNEVLAAGMILLSDWNAQGNFIDFMCGSGTLLIEAAMIAHKVPPNIFRESFSFEKWKNFNPEIWENVLDETLDIKISKSDFKDKILGGDISGNAIEISKKNINNTIFKNYIDLRTTSFTEMKIPEGGGTIIIDPPYDERFKEKNVEVLYQKIGDFLKQNCMNYDVWILSGNRDAIKKIGLRKAKTMTLFNGSLECKFLKYEIYKGSKKKKNNLL